MHNEKQQRAEQVYSITKTLANKSGYIQAVSAIWGGGVNLIVDGAITLLYRDMWNDIRAVYGRGKITLDAVKAFIKANWEFLLTDLIVDKGLGSIPIIGMPFNYTFAKELAFRLGAWMGAISVIGEDIPSHGLSRTMMQLVKTVFPREERFTIWHAATFRYTPPNKARFIAFISSMETIPPDDAEARVEEALNILRGKKSGDPVGTTV